MDTIKLATTTLSALALGAGERVVLIHGLVSGSMASWYFAIGQPLSATQRVLMYDQRGHGSSPVTPDGYDLDTQVADLTAVLAHDSGSATDSGVGPVDLVGHSMGALIALHFAQRYPARVRRLILIDAPLPAREHVLPSLLAMSSQGALQQHIDHQHQPRLLGRRRERVLQRLSSLIQGSSLIADVTEMGRPDAAALTALEHPALLVYGRHSPCIDSAAWLESALPNAQLTLLECGHYVLEEAPLKLLAAIRGFLQTPAAPFAAADDTATRLITPEAVRAEPIDGPE